MNSTLKTFGGKLPEYAITEHQLRNIGARLQVLNGKIGDALNETRLLEDYRTVLVDTYYRCLGIREFLGALHRNDLEDFIENTEIFVDAITKVTAEDEQ